MKTDRRLIEFARTMRREPAPAERLLWKLLRHHSLAGFRFRRQHPIPPYIADFYCAAAKLVIELDGDSHVDPESLVNDRVREQHLESLGLRVLRFWNVQLYEDQDCVLEAIYQATLAGVQSNPAIAKHLDEWGTLLSSQERTA